MKTTKKSNKGLTVLERQKKALDRLKRVCAATGLKVTGQEKPVLMQQKEWEALYSAVKRLGETVSDTVWAMRLYIPKGA